MPDVVPAFYDGTKRVGDEVAEYNNEIWGYDSSAVLRHVIDACNKDFILPRMMFVDQNIGEWQREFFPCSLDGSRTSTSWHPVQSIGCDDYVRNNSARDRLAMK